MAISKSDIIKSVAESCHTTQSQVALILSAIKTEITKSVSQGYSASLGKDFGTFKAVTTKARKTTIPGTTRQVDVLAKQVIKFSPSSVLKSAVNTL